ncbi:hypothetical protein QJQ45_028426 [Haematococcus lacustris]|nr:hypothetical protein QJQ45_028426 [Haematococcus lacustris]
MEQNETSSAETPGNIGLLQRAASYLPTRHNIRHGALPYHHLPALAAAAWYDQPANTALQTTHADMQADKLHAAQPHHHHLPALTAAGGHDQPYDTEMPATHAVMQADKRYPAQPHHHLPALTAAGWHDQPYDTEMPATHAVMQADKRHAAQPHHHLPALTFAGWHDQPYDTEMPATHAVMQADKRHAAQPHHHLPALTAVGRHDQPYDTEMPATHAVMQADKRHAAQPHHHLPALTAAGGHDQPYDTEMPATHAVMQADKRHAAQPHHHLPALTAAGGHDQPYDTEMPATHAVMQADKRYVVQPHHHLPALTAAGWHDQPYDTEMPATHAVMQADKRHAAQPHHHLPALTFAGWHDQPYDTEMPATHAAMQADKRYAAQPHHHLPALTAVGRHDQPYDTEMPATHAVMQADKRYVVQPHHHLPALTAAGRHDQPYDTEMPATHAVMQADKRHAAQPHHHLPALTAAGGHDQPYDTEMPATHAVMQADKRHAAQPHHHLPALTAAGGHDQPYDTEMPATHAVMQADKRYVVQPHHHLPALTAAGRHDQPYDTEMPATHAVMQADKRHAAQPHHHLPALTAAGGHDQPYDTEMPATHAVMQADKRHAAQPHHHLPALTAAGGHDQPYDTEMPATHAVMQADKRYVVQPHHHLPALTAAGWHDQPYDTEMPATHAVMQADKRHAAQPHHHLPALTFAGWHDQPYDTEMPATHAAMQADKRYAAQPHHHLPALTAVGRHDQPYDTEMPATHAVMQADKRHAAQPHHHLPALTAAGGHDQPYDTEMPATHAVMQADKRHAAQPHHHLPALTAAGGHDQPYDTEMPATHAVMQADKRYVVQPHHHLPALTAAGWHDQPYDTEMPATHAVMQADKRHAAQPHHHLPALTFAGWHDQPYDTEMPATHAAMQADKRYAAQPHHHLPALTAVGRHDQPYDTEVPATHAVMQADKRHAAQPHHHLPALTAAGGHDQPYDTEMPATHAVMQADKRYVVQPHHHLPALIAAGWHDQPYDTEMPATHAVMQADKRHAAQPHHHHLPTLTAAGRHDQPYDTGMSATHAVMQADKRYVDQPHHHLPALTAVGRHDQPYDTDMLATHADMQDTHQQPYPPHHQPQPTHIGIIIRQQEKLMNMLMLTVICTHLLTTIYQRMNHPLKPTRKDSKRCLKKHKKLLSRIRATVRTTCYNLMIGIDGTQAASCALCKLANRFHLSTHGANSSHPFTVNQFNSTLHVYCTYQVAANRNKTENTPCTVDPLSAARAVYLAWLLLAAGDVEANPGPINEHYQQARHSSACQIYSLNNAAGHEWVTMHDIDHFYDSRLLQLTDFSERGAWLMARGAGGYSDEVIEMYLRVHYGLAVQSIAQLNQPNDWTANNLGNLACQYGTHTFLCRRPGHSMAMTCKDGTWHLLDSMKSTPTPISLIPAAAKRTMHQLFVITPNTRSREQIRLCEEKGIHNIISHEEHTSTHNRNTTAVEPTPHKVTAQNLAHPYMERQYEECCLVHAFNMAMGKKCIDYHAVINHCKQLAEHLQHLAQAARDIGNTVRTFKTEHIYHANGKFSSDTLNHYLYRKHQELHTYLHPASTYLPIQSITPEVITAAIASTGATCNDAVILLSYQHATTIKHTHQGWHQLDSFHRMPKPLSTPDDWGSLQGNLLTICTGNVRHTRYIRREIWIADPLEAATPSAVAEHFRDHLDPIDLTTDHTEARETPGPLHETTTTAETSCTTDSTRRATAEGIPPHDEPTRLRQRRDTPTVTLRPQTTRIHRPTTPLDNATDAAKKRVRVTKRHGNDTHTQTLMFKYLCKPTAETHNTGPVSTIDETPKPTPDIDLGTNQRHTPPPPPTPNRQHITLTTLNVRGLHRSRNEVLNLVHSQSPDILILTETMTQPKSNNPSSGWLKRVLPNYTVHRHQGHSEVLIGIRHDLAIQMQATMIQPCTDADVNTRCVILSLRQRQSEELTLVATYWPSGNNDDALPLRKKMQEHIRTTIGHLPGSLILAGDINATMKTEDRSEHTEYTQDNMMREFATEMSLSEADPGDRAWTYQQPHCNSRIDAILTRDARHGPEHRTHVDTHAYLSDHRPLTATLSTTRLGIDLAAPQKPQKHSHTILTTPITNKDREAYRLAVQQPSSETDTTNAETREAVQARQGDDTTENHVQAALARLTNSYRDQIHKLDDDDSALAIAQARVRMQQLISTQPKKANKYILRPSRTDHKGLQALADPITNKICTAPADLNRIITEAYGTKLAPPTPKTGNYTNTQTRNYPWARAKADDPFTMHTCQNVHWLHTAIMDKASFQECLSRLSGGKAPGPDGIENEVIKMLPWEMRDTIHQLFIIMWATGCTPTTWKTSDTCLLYKDKGQETDLNSYRPVGLANTVYKLWTSLITKTLSEYAEANGMLSKNQAGFRSHRDTTQQLQMLVMALEDAKLAKADIYALLVDFTSAFNTTCQDKLLWIMHDLGFPTDATDAVKDLYTGATTCFRTPFGPTDPVPVDRGTIQGDSLSPFLFLIYIEPLLRWLQVGARGYKFKSAAADSGERATVSSIDYADDIAILCNTLRNLRCQADKLSAFSDWGHLIISHSKTLATAALHHSVETGMCSNAAEADKRARQQLQTVSLQGKPVTYHRPTSPFTYLGVLITMTLDWKPQHTAMITQLRHKLERLRRSFASARQAIHIIRTAIIPSLAYSFCAVPCTPGDLELYDRSINQCVKLKLRLPLGTPNAIVREDAGKLGMGISSTAQEYHARNTTALTHSLQSTDVTHAHISRSMLHKQITWLNTQANTQGHRMLTLFHHTLRARQLVYTSLAGLSATEGGLPLYPKECQTLGRLITQASSSNAHDVVSASITCLKSLGITHASELSCEGNTHIITGSMLTSKYGKKVKQKHIIALNKLAAMAAQPSCPDATATRTIRDSRNTSLTLPPDQRKITPWAAGLTELAPTPAVPDTRNRYMDMKAYAATHATQPDTTERAAAAAAPDAIRARSRLLQREQRATSSHPTEPTRPKAGAKRHKDGRHVHTIPADIVRIPGLDLPGLSSWKVDKACRCKLTDLGHILGAMYDHQEVITNIDGWQWDGINKESYYKVHWKPTVIERWALHLCAKEGYTPTHIETISREEAKDVCTCELCWLPRGDCPTCHNCKRAYHPACLENALLSGHLEPGYWLCPICKFGSNDFKTTMRQSAHSDLIRVHWRPTHEPAPLITAHLDYMAQRNIYDEENRTIHEARHARPDANLPDHTRQGLPDPHTWLPRCTNLHSKATFHTYPINPQTDIVGTGKCETFLQLHPHLTTPAMSLRTGEPIMPKHDLVQHVTVHDETGRTAGLLTKQQHQHLHAWLQHTPHARNLATELVALLRRHDTQSNHHPMRAAQDKALATLHTTRSFPSTVQRWANPLTVRPETATYWSPDINDTAFGAHHNCLLVRHTGLSTWNVPADDAVALKCVNHALHSATQEEAMATIMLIPGKKGISYPKHIDTLRRYPEYCQHLASIPPTKTTCSKPGKHAKLHIYVIWNAAGQQLVTKGNPQGWLASTATALHPHRDTHPIHKRPTNQSQPATPPSGHKQHMRLPLDRVLPTAGHQRSHQQLTQHSTTQPRMAITEWATLAYTDGSCIKTSGAAPASVGAGVYIPETNVLITVTLDDPESNTINKAELTAIHAALTAGAKRIATDSLCSIYQIRRALANPMSLITHRHNDILTAIATLIIDSPVTIHFYKVRAHSGIIGNEGADALAKHAALHPELANTPAYRPTTRKETNTWLSNEADGESPAPLPDCRQSVRAHMHRKHSLGLANQDSIYYQMSQEITKAAARGAGARVMTDTNISIPAQRTALLYRTGGLYNQKLAMRWKRATDDRCPLCGEADSATHLLSGCSETLPMVQERHNGAGRLISKAISKGTLGGCIRFADTGSWENGARENLDLPNDSLHTTLRALGLKPTATKNTTRPDILMVIPTMKTGKRGKATKRVIIIETKYCSDSRRRMKARGRQGRPVSSSGDSPAYVNGFNRLSRNTFNCFNCFNRFGCCSLALVREPESPLAWSGVSLSRGFEALALEAPVPEAPSGSTRSNLRASSNAV